MLAKHPLKAFIPTVKPTEALAFYRRTLGLKLLSQDPYGMEFEAHGTLLRIITVPKLSPHRFTALGWNVPRIKTTIQALNRKGVTCERFPGMPQDDLGIWVSPNGSKVAWFKDPDGNILSLTEQ